MPRYIQQYVVLLTKDTVDTVLQGRRRAVRREHHPRHADAGEGRRGGGSLRQGPTPEANDYPAIYRWLTDARKYDILPAGICEAKKPYKLG